MESNILSKKLLKRLPLYLNYLKGLPDNRENISATVMARDLGLGDVQVRKDLAKISQAGRSRTGRSRQQLIRDIEGVLDVVVEAGTVVIGTGKLGQALLDYRGFAESGLNLMAGFDICPSAEQTQTGKPMYPISILEAFCRYYEVHIGVIAVPADNAQEVCDRLVACGVKAIWNFAPVRLRVPESVIVQNENLAVALNNLRFELQSKQILR